MDKKVYERPVIIKQYSGLMNKFGGTTDQTPIKDIDGVSVKQLVEDFGSPLFVMSEDKIRANQRKMLRIFKTRYPKVQFAWSYKTNYLDSVCSVFHQEGSWAEVVSEFEYDKARKLGVPGEKIIFNGPEKSSSALIKAIKENAKIHIDHFDELYQIIEITESLNLKANVAIRVNMDVGIYPKWDRFGFNYENGEAEAALRRIVVNDKLNLIGLHTHIGTYIMSAEPYRLAAVKIVELFNKLIDEYDITLEYIDMGGGLPSNNTLKGQYLEADQILPSYEQFADAVTSPLFDTKLSGDKMPLLILESGRALIDDAGYLISEVIGNKRLADGRRAVILNAGVNLLFTSFWFKHKIVPAQDTGGFTENSSVYGPLCMNIDCLREEIVLPALKRKDHVVILNTGAYSVTQWMQFITMRPKVVMIMQDKTVELIRDSENLEYITSPEKLPEKLKEFSL
ncbi:MAG: alanine racemase [Bacteroidetes bacterium]|nr:alanine racemase [Bacteroidota bacterium]